MRACDTGMAMNDEDEHPELAEDDADEGRPAHSIRRQRMMRIIGTLGLIALILPGLLVTIRVQGSTAAAACRLVVQAHDADAIGSTTRFELAGPEGPGWYCYSIRFGGTEVLLRSLGLIPGLGPQDVESPGVPV
jgi:hypothetical protein